jgi:hypothetical protein
MVPDYFAGDDFHFMFHANLPQNISSVYRYLAR